METYGATDLVDETAKAQLTHESDETENDTNTKAGKGEVKHDSKENGKDDQLLSSGPIHDHGDPNKLSGKAWGRVKNMFTRRSDYPFCVFFVLGNEFCERFSYYGMRAILVLYLTRWLLFDADTATKIYHASSMLCYFLPILGAILADSYLGRYRTILYLSVVYALGSLVMSLTALPPPEWYGAAVGLVLIAIGTGGIKPCVSTFGADQFRPGQEKQMDTFFSTFYFVINLGSMLSMLITPVLRGDVRCFNNECYPLAFGLPAVLMVLSLLVFFAGRNSYKQVPPVQGNLLGKVTKCIIAGAKGKIQNKNVGDKKEHWLDHAEAKFEPDFIDEVKTLLKVLTMFLPLPLFWTLSNQQGSRWTLQAEQMDGQMGPLGILKPDQIQALNPLLIIVLIPIFESVVYPLITKCGIPNRPLQRMVFGLFLSSSAFVVAGFVQLRLDNVTENPLTATEVGVTYINTLPCDISIKSQFFKGQVGSLQASDFTRFRYGDYTIEAKEDCQHREYSHLFVQHPSSAYRMFVVTDNNILKIKQIPDVRSKPIQGRASISIFSTVEMASVNVVLSDIKLKGRDGYKVNTSYMMASDYLDLKPSSYTVYVPGDDISPNNTMWKSVRVPLHLGAGARYTLLLYRSNATSPIGYQIFTGVEENSVSMFLLVPQYLLITVGEILFSITGLGFAYSQAPRSMKSVVQAAWLMTTAVGDLVVVIIAGIKIVPNQSAEFFLYAGLMFVDTLIFMIMSLFYKYSTYLIYDHETKAEDTTSLVTSSPTNTPEENESSL